MYVCIVCMITPQCKQFLVHL